MTKKYERIEIEMARKRVPLTKILGGREFSDVLAEMKKFRAQFAEQEILYKAKVYITFSHGEAMAFVRRPETDNEYAKRIELLKQEERAKLERKRIREEKARIRAEMKQAEAEAEAEAQRQRDIETVKLAAKRLRLTAKDLLGLDG